MMPNGDPQDRFFYPTLTLMQDSHVVNNTDITPSCKELILKVNTLILVLCDD